VAAVLSHSAYGSHLFLVAFVLIISSLTISIETAAAAGAASLLGSTGNSCTLIFTNELAGSSLHFDPKSILPESLVPLSTHVYKVTLNDGREIVLRVPSLTEPLDREIFATQFLNQFNGLKTPEITLLSAEDSASISEILNIQVNNKTSIGNKHPQGESSGNSPSNIRLTATPFIQAETGRTYLASFRSVFYDITGLTAHVFSLFSTMNLGGGERRNLAINRFSLLWENAEPNERSELIADLKQAMPESKSISEEEYLQYLAQHMSVYTRSRLQQVIPIRISKLPKPIIQQLSDYWLIFTILQLPDFHSRNWLYSNGNVIGIDLAHKRQIPRDMSAPLDLVLQQHPFGHSEITETIRQAIYSCRISTICATRFPEYCATLKRLSSG
jgi:hypothetical protein